MRPYLQWPDIGSWSHPRVWWGLRDHHPSRDATFYLCPRLRKPVQAQCSRVQLHTQHSTAVPPLSLHGYRVSIEPTQASQVVETPVCVYHLHNTLRQFNCLARDTCCKGTYMHLAATTDTMPLLSMITITQPSSRSTVHLNCPSQSTNSHLTNTRHYSIANFSININPSRGDVSSQSQSYT